MTLRQQLSVPPTAFAFSDRVMSSIVVSYRNPDLDGVACAIAISSLEPVRWEARVIGAVDAETKAVLDELGLPVPRAVEDWTEIGDICLVDTHHLRQLPDELPRERVTRVIDHHSGGNPEAFRNAVIQNEPVGAAATLVAERRAAQGGDLPWPLGLLLQAAIVSNTLDFGAVATSSRDRQAFERLAAIEPLSHGLRQRMQEARRTILGLSSAAVVEKDCKLFDTPGGLLLVSQVEAPGALGLLDRVDLSRALLAAAAARHARAALLNLVDTQASASALIASSPELLATLNNSVGGCIDSAGVLRAPRLLQRKTDIIPHLLAAGRTGAV